MIHQGIAAPWPLKFRRLNPEDAHLLHKLEKECFSQPWSLPQYRKALAQDAFMAYGLWNTTRLFAYLTCYCIQEELEIVNIAVHASQRHKGLGTGILRLVLQAAHKMGMQKALLEVRQNNFAAIAMYEKTGFTQSGTRVRYYSDTGEDALIYTYNFQSTPAYAAKDDLCKK